MRRWIFVVMAACGTDNGGSITFAQYESQAATAYCSYLAKCGLFPDAATCEQANTGIITVADPSLAEAIAQGRVAFDGDDAAACLSQFSNESCDQTMSRVSPTICNEIVSGTVGSGGMCAIDQECISQACDVPSCEQACCQGTCVGGTAPALQPTGAPCTSDESCVAGDYCDSQADMCAPYVAAGSACADSFACAPGFGCAGTPLVCKTLPGTGAACPDGVCANVGEHCGSAGTCVKDGLPGDSCVTNSDCSEFFTCDPSTMQCMKGPSLGEPCPDGTCFDANTFCTDELGSATPTCAAAGSDGATCNSIDQCISGNCDNNVCDTPAACD
jgi:Dickkopf N-terminal cysteine-rich region